MCEGEGDVDVDRARTPSRDRRHSVSSLNGPAVSAACWGAGHPGHQACRLQAVDLGGGTLLCSN